MKMGKEMNSGNRLQNSLSNLKNSLKDVGFIFRHLLRSAPALTVFSLLVFTVVGLMPIAIAYVYKLLIDSFTSGTETRQIGTRFILIVVVYLSLIIVDKLMSYLKEHVNLPLGLKMSHAFSLMYVGKFKELDLRYLDNPKFSDIVALSRSDSTQHPEKLLFKFIDILENLVSVVAYSALVGDNGSGKSTIMKLLLRLYDPLDYYSTVGAMFQNCINYAASVEESVYLGDISAGIEDSSKRIDEALMLSSLYSSEDEISASRPKETSREFSENSFEPSVGELQKLAMARTFFRRGELVILDEPTSSLDALSEKKLFERIFALKSGVSTLMITHRLSDMDKCDHIIVLDKGKVIESGTHAELMAENGHYSEMYKRQSQHYA